MSTDIIVTGDETTVVEVYVDGSDDNIEVIVSDPEDVEVVEVEVPGEIGPIGPQGGVGPVGPQGPQGLSSSFSYVFNFAVPSTVWHITHNLSTWAINIELFDSMGEEWMGAIRYLDENSVDVEWYYPMSGYARIFS